VSDLGDRFERLVDIVRHLRAPDGCPWDRAQTHESLRPYVLEEAHEVVLAIAGGDPQAVCAELGDLLLQVCLHAVIAEQAGSFDPAAIVDGLSAKLIRRHPHVFGEAAAAGSPQEVERRWAELKRAEAAASGRTADAGLLDSVPHGLPALAEAEGLGRRAAEVGFDWPNADAAWPKVTEEREELRAAWRSWEAAGRPNDARRRAVERELGDLLLAVVNVARLLGVNAELALIDANDKFRRRFSRVERDFPGGPGALRAAGLEALEASWQGAKADESPNAGGA
jgi:MazG family protein